MKIHALLALTFLLPNLSSAQGLSSDSLSFRLKMAKEYMALNPIKQAVANSVGDLAKSPTMKPAFEMVNYRLLDLQGAELMAEVFTAEEIKALLDFQKSSAGQRILLKMPEYQKIMGSRVQTELRKAYETTLNPLAGMLAPTAPAVRAPTAPALKTAPVAKPATPKPAPKPLGTGLGSPIRQ